jgi:hypothetical protein
MAAVTVEGCLMKEADVPGRKPNVAERAGITEDYILTQTKMVKGDAPGMARKAPADKPAAMSDAMYEVEGLSEDRLKPHIGHRVQIDGTFANTDRPASTAASDPNRDLVELRATTIRMVSASCPGK